MGRRNRWRRSGNGIIFFALFQQFTEGWIISHHSSQILCSFLSPSFVEYSTTHKIMRKITLRFTYSLHLSEFTWHKTKLMRTIYMFLFLPWVEYQCVQVMSFALGIVRLFHVCYSFKVCDSFWCLSLKPRANNSLSIFISTCIQKDWWRQAICE